MKLHLPHALLTSLLAASFVSIASASSTSSTDLGTVMYVGDSITHGVNSASYRWELHKIFVDNGFTCDSVGVKTGNYSGGVSAGTTYGGVAFNNVHSSQASARAWEIAGRKDGARFDDSNIMNWLGQSSTKNNGAAYTGQTFTGENAPDTYFLLIGTNDLLSDISSNKLSTQLTSIQSNLLNEGGDMDTILGSMRKSNPDSRVVVLSIPCWTTHANNNAAATHEAVAAYNTALEEWAARQTNVTLVDVNEGMLDVASATPFAGCSSMFNKPGTDGLHPNAQGDLIMAGNIAKALGYAGRSVGQERLGTEGLAVSMAANEAAFEWEGVSIAQDTANNISIDLGAEGTSSLSYSWAEGDELAAGFTLDLVGLTLGNGAEGGWDTAQDMSVTFGTSEFYGTLNINEAYIKWGDTVLYSTDMSQTTDTVRVSWLAGNNMEGIASGYYVWLGDMLIGEALGVTYGSGGDGLSISYSGSGVATLSGLALGTGSYAPTTTGLLNENNAFTSAGAILPAVKGEPQGNITWQEGGSHTADSLAATDTFNARAQVDSTTGASDNVVNTTITSGSASIIYGNSGNYEGDVWLTISNEGGASSWYGVHGGSGTLTGNASLRITGDAVGGSTVFGAVNATKVTGNVYVDLSAEEATFGTFTNTPGKKASLVGSYATDIGGNVDLVVNAGTLQHDVLGGIFTGNKTIEGQSSVYVNGGSIGGKVMGGGYTGTITGGTRVVVTYGNIAGNVYGGGGGGTIKAPVSKLRSAAPAVPTTFASSVELTGGTISGDVYGGGSAGTIEGNTGVSVIGSAVRLYDGTNWGNIIGGGADGCTVTGDALVTLSNIVSTNDAYGFDKYAGTISGGNVQGTTTLLLDHVQVAEFGATLSGFDTLMAINGTETALSSFGGATTVSIGDGCSLSLDGESSLTKLVLGEGSRLSIRTFSAESVQIDITGISDYSITLNNVTDVSNITFVDGDKVFAAVLKDVDTQANSGLLVANTAAVPEPATATLSLLALAALAARRRRA